MADLNALDGKVKKIENELMSVQRIDKEITVTAGEWASTGIKLSNGVYIFTMYVNSAAFQGNQWNETYTGILSSYSALTNSNEITEIPMTNSGHAPNNRFCTLGFKRVPGNTGQQELVVSANESFQNCLINFVFRKVM